MNLTFETTVPYVPDGDRTVTVEDANFSIPPMVEEPACEPLIREEINNQIAGAGHSLTLTLEGDITPPPPPGCPTVTTLGAAPEDEADLAAPVELTATVSPEAEDPLCIEAETNGDVLAGFVDFFDGPVKIGSVPVAPDGTAVLTSSSIPAGTRSLTATYGGGGAFEGSDPSEPLSYRITPKPTISADLPEFVRIGAGPTEFDVSVTNTGFGGAITNGRFDLTLGRPPGFAAELNNDRVLVEYLDGTNTWAPVALTPVEDVFNLTLFGHVGPATGFALGVGETVTQRMRIRFLTTGGAVGNSCTSTEETCPGPVAVAVELVEVDGGTGLPAAVVAPSPDAITGASGTITVIETTRRASTVSFGPAFSGGPVSPYKVRQGGTVSLPGLNVGPTVGNRRPTGSVEVLLDGQHIPVRRIILGNVAPTAPPVDQVPLVAAGVAEVSFDLPPRIALGAHQVTVRYLGDPVFLPSQNTTTITVIETTGVLYDCLSPSTTNTRYRAFVEAQLSNPLPSVRPAGSSLPLSGLSLRLLFSRDVPSQNNSRSALAPANGSRAVGPTLSVDVGFGPGGTGTAAGITRENGNRLNTSPSTLPVDEIITLTSPTGAATLNGAPGALVPITLDEIKLTGTNTSNLTIPITCTPLGDPVTFGSVTLSGHTLTVDPAGSVWEGDPVMLSSEVEPYTTGQVEFRDGATTIGVVPVVDGLASTVVTDLPAGTRSLTAVWSGGILAPALASNTVELEVVHVECREFAEEGHGATVRLVYLELLGRCPDQAGFDYWVSRLQGGLSAEAFARTIARTTEAVGRVVDDAYQTMLGRSADAAGRAFWTSRLQRHGRYDHLLADLGASGEFWDLSGGTNVGFVTRVYERLLSRSPDQGGLDYWTGKLATGSSRRALILTLANLNEPLGVLVTDSYDEILDRAPEAVERTDGIADLRSTGDRSGLYAELIGRPEFADRAQGFPNPA